MYYTISQAAEKSGINAHTLRYYDKEGLLPFVERSSSGVRKFSDADMQWLELITCLKETGLPIKQIKQYIDWGIEGDSTLEKRYLVFIKQKKSIESQMMTLQKHLEKIEKKIKYYDDAMKCSSEQLFKQANLSRN